ncbi:MAG: ATP synthase F1 subunit delta [Pirellulales bacterium]|nr:ATP synthase F1 subunit delta [Pirellulales bacterium]
MAETQASKTSVDTGQQYLAAVYAKALLGATERAGNTEAVLEELEALLSEVFQRLPKLESALTSPRVGQEEKLRLLELAIGSRVSQSLLDFLKVLARRGRLDCLRAITRAARQQLNEIRGRVEVTLVTAEPLGEDSTRQAAERLQTALGQEIDLSTSVDPDLIGGAIVRVGDTIFDGSVINRLEQMRRTAHTNSAQKMRDELDRFATSN